MYDIKNDPVFKNDPMIKSEEDIYVACHVAHEEFYGSEEQNQQEVYHAFKLGQEAPTIAIGLIIFGAVCWVFIKLFS